MEKEAPRPLADRLRPRKLAEVVGQDHLVGAGGHADAHAQERAPAEHDPVGSAGHRQDHGGAAAGGRDQARLRAALGDLLGRAGPAQGLRPRQEPARDRQGHAALHRRDPPLQPRAAGQLPAAHGGRHHHAGRCHHREPLLRAQRRAAVARAGAGVPPARRGGARASCWRGPSRRRAGRCRSMRRRARRSRPWPTATAARCSTWWRRSSARWRRARAPLGPRRL